jgi:TorA maturation chaperone TorD
MSCEACPSGSPPRGEPGFAPEAGALDLRELLERAAAFRLLSLLFRPPSARLRDEILELSEPLPAPVRAEAAALADLVGPDLEADHHRLLGACGVCPPGESDYVANPFGAKGGLLGDVSAFYRAFCFDPSAELGESPDHAAIELSFVSWMLVKVAYAEHANKLEEREVAAAALETFRAEHLDGWLAEMLDRLEEMSAGGFYAEVARFARGVACAGARATDCARHSR